MINNFALTFYISGYLGKAWIYSIFSTMDTFAFIATLHFAFLLATNRFVTINLSKFNFFFETKKIYFLIAFVWLSVFGRFILLISLK